jgi:Ca-activated chloride channel family protein
MVLANSEYLLQTVAASITVFIVYVLYMVYRYYIVSTYFKKVVIVSHYFTRYIVLTLLTAIILFLYSLLVLRPQWGFTLKERQSRGVDLVVALDVSRSMLTKDVGSSRLARAKNAIRYAAESLPGRMGLIIFAGEAFVQSPLTIDRSAFLDFLDYTDTSSIALQGTDIGKALEAAGRLFTKQNPNTKVLLLITDGEDHESSLRRILSQLKNAGVIIHTASIGETEGSPIPLNNSQGQSIYHKDQDGKVVESRADASLLKYIASETGGVYINLNGSIGQVKRILDKTQDGEKSDFGSQFVREGKDRFQLFAILCIILLIVELVLQVRWKK